MTAYRFVTLTCDRCGEIHDDGQSRLVRDARRSAKDEGWRFVDGQDECPRHHGWMTSRMTGAWIRDPTGVSE